MQRSRKVFGTERTGLPRPEAEEAAPLPGRPRAVLPFLLHLHLALPALQALVLSGPGTLTIVPQVEAVHPAVHRPALGCMEMNRAEG